MNKRRGFTLLEVMLALTIFALIAGALLSAVTTQVQTSDRLVERTLSRWVVSNAVQELQLVPAPNFGVYEENVSNFGRDWHITLIVEDVESSSYSPFLRRATIRVRLADSALVFDELVVLLAVQR